MKYLILDRIEIDKTILILIDVFFIENEDMQKVFSGVLVKSR